MENFENLRSAQNRALTFSLLDTLCIQMVTAEFFDWRSILGAINFTFFFIPNSNLPCRQQYSNASMTKDRPV